MKNAVNHYGLAFSLTLLLLAGCQPKQEPITPSPSFSYGFATPALRTILPGYGVGIGIKLTNASTDAVSYHWDFGDGTSSTQKEPTIAYYQAGSYSITLTTTSSTGNQRVSSQSIKILDCVLKSITIRDFTWNSIGQVPGWDSSKQADLRLELGQRTDTDPPLGISHRIYQSEVQKNVRNTANSFPIAVNQKVLLNPDQLTNFMINLYGDDGSGSRVVFSSNASMVGYSASLSSQTGVYSIVSGPVRLEGRYE